MTMLKPKRIPWSGLGVNPNDRSGKFAKMLKAGEDNLFTCGSDENEWELEVSDGSFFRFRAAPNRFHRWVQWLAFGFKWRYCELENKQVSHAGESPRPMAGQTNCDTGESRG